MESPKAFNRFAQPWVVAFFVITVLYWSWFGLLVGVESTDIALFGLITIFFFFNHSSRKLFVIFSPFFIYLVFYNSLRVLHKYNPFPVHIEDLYNAEVSLFGIYQNGMKVSMNEFFIQHSNLFSDIFSGMFYITWVPFPILFGFYLFFMKRPEIAYRFWVSFLIANLFGFIGYITYPAAPPWYYLEYGNELLLNVPGNAAGLAKFDELLNINMYTTMYSQGTNTFGAMPSMHAAFPLMLVFYAMKYKNKWFIGLFTISMIGIWYGAVYTAHHYILDILMGIVCGILGLIITELYVNRKFVPKWHKFALAYIR